MSVYLINIYGMDLLLFLSISFHQDWACVIYAYSVKYLSILLICVDSGYDKHFHTLDVK